MIQVTFVVNDKKKDRDDTLEIIKEQLKSNSLVIKNFLTLDGINKVEEVYKLSSLNRITLINLEGKVLFDSASNTKESHRYRSEVVEAIEKDEGFQIRYSETLKKKMIYYSTVHNDIVVRVAQSYAEVDEKLFSSILNNVIYYIILNVFLFLAYKIILKKYYFEKLTTMKTVIQSGKEAKELYLEEDKDLVTFWHVIKDWQNKNLENIETLKEEKEKLHKILESVDLCILFISAQSEIVSNNQEAKYNFFNGIDSSLYYEKLRYTEVIEFIDKTITHKTEFTDEIFIHDNGKYYIAKGKYLPEYAKFIFTFRDITHVKEKSRLEKKFITNISHELKTPLTNIKGYLYAIEDEEDKEMQKNFIGIVNRNIDKLEAIIGDFLNFQRLEANKIVSAYPTDIKALVEKVIEGMDKIIEKKNASVTANYFVKDMNYYINIDGEKIKTLLKNLIENAIIYNDKEKPEVSLTVEENRNIIKFKVKDNGIGMPEKELNNIFDSFYRVDKARTSNMAGTGLGLSIVKEIVDIHKGDIKVNSQEGQGTEFVIRIPK